jgi:hypothetical protein
VPIEDYMVYMPTFSGAREHDLFSRPNVRKIPTKKSIQFIHSNLNLPGGT